MFVNDVRLHKTLTVASDSNFLFAGTEEVTQCPGLRVSAVVFEFEACEQTLRQGKQKAVFTSVYYTGTGRTGGGGRRHLSVTRRYEGERVPFVHGYQGERGQRRKAARQ